jgi:MOSC domain-containing protein YiiM
MLDYRTSKPLNPSSANHSPLILCFIEAIDSDNGKIAMTGEISQINISPGGIPKRALLSGNLTPRGLDGDSWRNPKYHGGPNQALLLIGREVVDELNSLGYRLFAGALGENLTTMGLDYRRMQSGQQYRLGSLCEIELTKLREPCRTLDVYNEEGIGKIHKLLKLEGRGGWYARVLKAGPLFPGDKITLLAQVV